jgi:hypothetical protein
MGVPLMDNDTFAWFVIAVAAIWCVVGVVVFLCSL